MMGNRVPHHLSIAYPVPNPQSLQKSLPIFDL